MPSGSIAHPPEHELRKLVDEAVMEECRLGSRGLWLCVDRVEQVGQPRERLKVWATLHFLQAGSPFCCGEPECQLGLIERGEPIAELQPVEFDIQYPDFAEPLLTEAEKAQLAGLVEGGTLEVGAGGRFGSGARTKVKVVLVLHEPVEGEQRFPLPAEGTAFIVQRRGDWVFAPYDYPRLKRGIVLSNREASWEGDSWTATRFHIEMPDGSRSGEDAVAWK